MLVINQEKYIKAWNFASQAHKNQFLPGTDIPYLSHIGLVSMECMSALHTLEDNQSADRLILCAILHDTLEDTKTSYKDIQKLFGNAVANGVAALSKNKNLATKKEKMLDSLARIKEQPQEVWMVKLADRITNLQPPPPHWADKKILAYQKEAQLILQELGSANNFLAKRLEEKINEYQNYTKEFKFDQY